VALQVDFVKARPAPIGVRWLRAVLQQAAELPEVKARLSALGASLTLKVSGDRELHRLNRTFLGEDHTTDVLSFPSGERGYLGDIVISWPAVERQAAEFGHPVDVEAALLAVHGLLHLLGWDHADARSEAEMTRLALRALERVGVQPAANRL
jgi:probable rRNA maturation factor